MTDIKPYPKGPGDFIREELTERECWDWFFTHSTLHHSLGPSALGGLLDGSTPIDGEIALELGTMFGKGAQYWLDLDTSFRTALREGGWPDPAAAPAQTAALFRAARKLVDTAMQMRHKRDLVNTDSYLELEEIVLSLDPEEAP